MRLCCLACRTEAMGVVAASLEPLSMCGPHCMHTPGLASLVSVSSIPISKSNCICSHKQGEQVNIKPCNLDTH